MVEEEYKGYKITSDGKFNMKIIKPVGKGSVNKALRGMYTTSFMAKRAIDLHLKTKKVNESGETE